MQMPPVSTQEENFAPKIEMWTTLLSEDRGTLSNYFVCSFSTTFLCHTTAPSLTWKETHSDLNCTCRLPLSDLIASTDQVVYTTLARHCVISLNTAVHFYTEMYLPSKRAPPTTTHLWNYWCACDKFYCYENKLPPLCPIWIRWRTRQVSGSLGHYALASSHF